MTKDTFGEHLKREREMRGVSLDEIAAATRIATRFLQAIEEEHWDQLPGGVFNRGFVRAVARYLGLDEESTVAEYVSAAGDRTTVPVWTGSPPAVTPEQPWLAWILAAVVVLLLATAAWFAVRRFFAWRASRRSAPIAAQSAAWSPDLTVLASTTDSGRFSAERLRTSSTDSTASPRAVIRWSPLAARRSNLKSMPTGLLAFLWRPTLHLPGKER
jgi:cytoskeletal protein RodZ